MNKHFLPEVRVAEVFEIFWITVAGGGMCPPELNLTTTTSVWRVGLDDFFSILHFLWLVVVLLAMYKYINEIE